MADSYTTYRVEGRRPIPFAMPFLVYIKSNFKSKNTCYWLLSRLEFMWIFFKYFILTLYLIALFILKNMMNFVLGL